MTPREIHARARAAKWCALAMARGSRHQAAAELRAIKRRFAWLRVATTEETKRQAARWAR